MQNNLRLQRGQEIADNPNHVKRLNENEYKVKSQTGNGEYYDIMSTELGWICSYSDHVFRGVTCKHIHAVEISLAIRKKVEKEIVIRQVNAFECPQCQSEQIVKHGIRHNKYGDIQRYSCNNCYKRFTTNLGFERMKATPQVITSALQLYFTGESIRNVQKFLKLQGVKISHMGVYKWINKYVTLMEKYLEQIKPNVSNVWRADELYLKVKGNNKYLFALMDDETRFWIAQQVADTKNTGDIRPLFKEGKEIAGKRPNVLITDFVLDVMGRFTITCVVKDRNGVILQVGLHNGQRPSVDSVVEWIDKGLHQFVTTTPDGRFTVPVYAPHKPMVRRYLTTSRNRA